MTFSDNDLRSVVHACQAHLELSDIIWNEDYFSLPLCVIDAVFSIGVRYESTRRVVDRFCLRFGLPKFRQARMLPPMEEQISTTAFLKLYEHYGIEGMANDVFQNRQRTSTRSGILKSEAVVKFAQVLHSFRADYLQDCPVLVGNIAFESAVKEIPGQASGISLRYFYILAGEDNYIKPDRMIERFVEAATGRQLSGDALHTLLLEACSFLQTEHPKLTPRMLDNLI